MGTGLREVDGRIEGFGEGDHLVDKTGVHDTVDHAAITAIRDGLKAAPRGALERVHARRSGVPDHSAACRVHTASFRTSIPVRGAYLTPKLPWQEPQY